MTHDHTPKLDQVREAQRQVQAMTRRSDTLDVDDQAVDAARLCVGAERWRDAADRFEKLLAEHPDHPGLLLEAGRLAATMGECARAIKLLTHAARCDGALGVEALRNLGETQLQAGHTAGAARTFHRLTRRRPEETAGWAGLIIAATLTRRPKTLLKARVGFGQRFTQADRAAALGAMWVHAAVSDALGETPAHATQRTTEPTPATATTTAIDPLKQLIDESAATLARAAGRFPDRADVHFHLAVCRDGQDDADAARDSIDRALRINPRYARAQDFAAQIADRPSGQLSRAA